MSKIRLTEAHLRKMIRKEIRNSLNEGFQDISYVKARLRVQINRPSDPSMADILTDLRGAENIITVRQAEPMTDAPENKNMVILNVGFDESKNMKVSDFIKVLRSLESVDMVQVLTVNGLPYKPRSGAKSDSADESSEAEVETETMPSNKSPDLDKITGAVSNLFSALGQPDRKLRVSRSKDSSSKSSDDEVKGSSFMDIINKL